MQGLHGRAGLLLHACGQSLKAHPPSSQRPTPHLILPRGTAYPHTPHAALCPRLHLCPARPCRCWAAATSRALPATPAQTRTACWRGCTTQRPTRCCPARYRPPGGGGCWGQCLAVGGSNVHVGPGVCTVCRQGRGRDRCSPLTAAAAAGGVRPSLRPARRQRALLHVLLCPQRRRAEHSAAGGAVPAAQQQARGCEGAGSGQPGD